MGWQGALLLTPASDLSRNGWFHCWATFTLSLQGKGFLEGTALPPIMIYLGRAGLPKKKENIFKRLEEALSFPHGFQVLPVHTDSQPAMQWPEHFQIYYLMLTINL